MLLEWPSIDSSRPLSKKAASSQERSSISTTYPPSSSSSPTFRASTSSQIATAAPQKCLKRSRLQEDGEQLQRKKRRLRLDLVTSRLSKPYATPTTHIVGRTHSRVGVWARQRLSGGKLLRKAAILNSIAMKRKRETAKAAMKDIPVPSLVPKPSSQSSLEVNTSEYDAFDREDTNIDYSDGCDTDTDEEENNSIDADEDPPIYSDFNMLDSDDSAPEFCDASYSFDSLNTGYQYAVEPGGKALDLVMENERQDEVSIAPTGSAFSFPFLPSSMAGS